ncbi:hypothetical protein EVAR_56547_1 [Eumeta japonica]|uniref:Uncharacterized protein n=1 Tax=Eumeta variegata TaxID=151549 RepID=A0A4C1Z039_EUMVA|nr:hypothetical protein EVAR_56547_1 [Eumeta japonica]
MSQGHKILHERLAVRNLCTRQIRRNLTEAQKLRRVNWCCEIMQRFAGGDSNPMCDIVIGKSLSPFTGVSTFSLKRFRPVKTQILKGRPKGLQKGSEVFSGDLTGATSARVGKCSPSGCLAKRCPVQMIHLKLNNSVLLLSRTMSDLAFLRGFRCRVSVCLFVLQPTRELKTFRKALDDTPMKFERFGRWGGLDSDGSALGGRAPPPLAPICDSTRNNSVVYCLRDIGKVTVTNARVQLWAAGRELVGWILAFFFLNGSQIELFVPCLGEHVMPLVYDVVTVPMKTVASPPWVNMEDLGLSHRSEMKCGRVSFDSRVFETCREKCMDIRPQLHPIVFA